MATPVYDQESNQNVEMLLMVTGAIIGDGDRKFWDARGSMIWDNFSIFRTNCVILTSHIRANPRTCCGFSRGCFHVADQMLRFARFSCGFFTAMAENEEPGLFYVLLCSYLIQK